MNRYQQTQAAVDRHYDGIQRDQELRDALDAEREARIVEQVGIMAARAHDDPAYGARLIDSAEIVMDDVRVRLHCESMTWMRAVLDVLHMGALRGDPEAIAVACEVLRDAVADAIRRDAAVYGMATEAVAMEWD